MPAPTAATHLLIPFAGRDAAECRAALATLRLPALEALLPRLARVHEDRQDEDSRSPPHERALARRLGIAADDGCIPWAALEARRAGLEAEGDAPGAWALATLCHWQVGLDDVVLGDPAALSLTADESDALLAAARPYFEEDGIALHASATPGRWLARGEVFGQLPTASIDRAVGRPIGPWLSMTDGARSLRRLQNEMQMLLYHERVNDQRVSRGLLPINSFWLSGTGRLPDPPPGSHAPAPQTADALRTPALRDDGAAWTAAWGQLDAGPVAALLAASRRGDSVSLTLCGDRAAIEWASRPQPWLQRLRAWWTPVRVAPLLESL